MTHPFPPRRPSERHSVTPFERDGPQTPAIGHPPKSIGRPGRLPRDQEIATAGAQVRPGVPIGEARWTKLDARSGEPGGARNIEPRPAEADHRPTDRKSTRLNSRH